MDVSALRCAVIFITMPESTDFTDLDPDNK